MTNNNITKNQDFTTFVQNIKQKIYSAKLKDDDEKEYYIRNTIENGWNRDVLMHHIKTNLLQIKKRLKSLLEVNEKSI